MLMTRSFVLSQSQYGCSVLLMSWSTALSKYEAPQTRISVSVSKLGCRKYYNLVFLRDFFLFFFGGPRYKKCPKKSLAFDTIITFLKTIAKHQIENGEESTCLKSHQKKKNCKILTPRNVICKSVHRTSIAYQYLVGIECIDMIAMLLTRVASNSTESWHEEYLTSNVLRVRYQRKYIVYVLDHKEAYDSLLENCYYDRRLVIDFISHEVAFYCSLKCKRIP